ncbi:hypothetical protein HSX10_03655 [Winogradskyella undariae]|uniref:hypothetical protein n=1 Tax=Winogradskyella undariae TaxID=1285465 RepID=UPI00156B02D5|nr:hypothetical protein [Winogradskyella undariae]NRR90655.1 hypothetical protein [Winogradskyella undariae]
MKKILLALSLILFVGLTAQATNQNPKSDETSISIPYPDIHSIMQISRITEHNRNDYNNTRFNTHKAGGVGYSTYFKTIGYGKNITVNIQAFRNTTANNIQTSYSKFKQTGQLNTSRMLLRQARGSAKGIQGDYDNATETYNKPTADYSSNYQRTQLFTKSVFLVGSPGLFGFGNYDHNQIQITQLNKA